MMQVSGTPADGAGLGSASLHPPCCQPTTRWPGQRPPLQKDPAPAPCTGRPGSRCFPTLPITIAHCPGSVFRGRSHRRNPPVVQQQNERGPVFLLFPVPPRSPLSQEGEGLGVRRSLAHNPSSTVATPAPTFLSQRDFTQYCPGFPQKTFAILGKSGDNALRLGEPWLLVARPFRAGTYPR